MDTNNKNVWFIAIFVVVLLLSFGVFKIVGAFDSSSMYTQLINGE
jgi:hypothetical protein